MAMAVGPSQNLAYMSVFEAFAILDIHDSERGAIKDICNKCNIPNNTVTAERMYRLFGKFKKQRLYARKKGNLDKWTSDIKSVECCKY